MNRTRTSKNAKRLLVWLLLTMVFGLLPMAAFADETVVEPVVSEEPVQETEPSSEPSAEPSQEPETIPEPEQPGDADVIIEGDEELEEAALTNNDVADVTLEDKWLNPSSSGSYNGGFMKIFFLDCGRKYFSVENIKKLIDNASAAGFNYIQLAVGNDGLRFLLNDMSLTVNGTPYTTEQVSNAIKTGNANYYNFPVNELTQPEMDTIIAYATEKKMGVIPCVNTPGHMDAILSAASSLTGTDCTFNSSKTTIDVTNATAVEFTQALLQKYISYFAGKGCQFFNMGADEYANDIYTEGSMGFGELTRLGQYKYYIQYVNQVAAKVREAGMYPMMFNDGVYFNGDTLSGTFNKSIIVCYWSSGWGGYSSMKPTDLVKNGYKVVNTHGDYYWVLGKGQCTAEKASQFKIREFMADTLNEDPSGAMFCIWCDYPGADTAENVVSSTAATIAAFGKTLPNPPTTGGGTTEPEKPDPANKTINLKVGDTATETVDGSYADVTTDDSDIAKVDPKVSDKPGTGTYTKVSKGEGTFFVSKNSAVTAEPPVTLTFEDAGNGMYYIKNGNEYVYPKWTYDWGSKYSVGLGKKEVDVNTSGKDGGYTISCSYTGSLTGSTYTAYLSYDNNGNLTAQSSHAKLYLYTKTDLEKQTTLTFTGVAPGTTYCTVGDTKYKIVVDYKQENISAYVGGTKTVENVSGKLDTNGLDTGVATVTLAGNVLTITGVSEGNTSVIVGDTKYTITVTAEDLSAVTPLTLEYWITNDRPTYNGVNTLTINAADEGVATRKGVTVNEVAPVTTERTKRELDRWQARLLDVELENNSTSGTEMQTNASGDDETLNGTAFTKIRYWNGEWQVYTNDWQKVDRTMVTVDGVTREKNQLVVYYMEKFNINNANGESELNVNVSDWGTKGDGSGDWGYNPEDSRCSVSVQIVYEDNSTNPVDTTAEKLKSKTILYGYWNQGRGLGTMLFTGQQNYEIYKVTAETGTMESTESGNYVTVTSFAWANNEKTVWEGEQQPSVSICNPTTNPSYESPYDNLAWNTSNYNKNNAILIRVYVKAKVNAASLTAHYIDMKSDAEFYAVNYNVKDGTVFDSGFGMNNGELVNNTVTNYNGIQQKVEADLKKMPEIGAQYRYGNFKLESVKRSEDGKDVFLYYTFVTNKTFVVDFGIPLKIAPKDFDAGLENANLTKVEAPARTTYASISTDNEYNVIYRLTKTLDSNDVFSVKYFGTNTAGAHEAGYSVDIIPATSVYYEDNDSIVKFINGTGKAEEAKWSIDRDNSNIDVANVNQALEALGKKTNVYGFDQAYENSSKFSLGSARKVTVDNSMRVDSNAEWPTASFTFKGTGFDIISLTNNQSGTIFVDVVRTSDNQKVKGYIVDNYYGYKQENGTWVVDPNSADTLYQIPVIKASGLDYNEYTVTVKVVYGAAADHTGKGSYSFWFDAFRVYNPMGLENKYIEEYVKDNEGYPQYIKLRDQLLNNSASATKMLFIDGAENASVADYKNFGPNNEVYLAAGQAISFTINGESVKSIQIGAKAPNGAAVLNVNGAEIKTLDTATEMYYDITEQATKGSYKFTITNTGNNILSLTNIKITFDSNATASLAELGGDDAVQAVSLVRSLYAAPVVEPVEPFKPDHFEAKWSNNVRQGGRAVLTVKTSADVEQIIINGDIVVSNYKTRTERVGYGRNAERVTYHVFTYMINAQQSAEYSVVAVNEAGLMSEAVAARLTVRPKGPIKDWFDGLFGRWF